MGRSEFFHIKRVNYGFQFIKVLEEVELSAETFIDNMKITIVSLAVFFVAVAQATPIIENPAWEDMMNQLQHGDKMRRAAEDSEGANDDTLDGLLGLPGIDTDFVGLEGLNKKPTKVSTPQPPKIPDLIKLPEFPNVYADTNSGTQGNQMPGMVNGFDNAMKNVFDSNKEHIKKEIESIKGIGKSVADAVKTIFDAKVNILASIPRFGAQIFESRKKD